MKKHLKTLLVGTLLAISSGSMAKVQHLLPKPQQIAATENVAAFDLSGSVTINYSEGAEKCTLLEEFFTTNGCTLAESGGKAVNVTMVESIPGAYDYTLYGYENEAYTLDVTADAINITAIKPIGVIRAAQTLVQMAEGWDGTAALEAVSIKDWPAFKLRGYMHDVGRSFISADELVKQVELFSRFKVNTFHWHMTENQAWRFEVKAYPQLTSAESMTRFAGQYYTQEDCKRVMAAAKKHGVIVVPEIDMPGHSEAFNRAMGFDMQSTQGKTALKKVLDEVAEVFADAPYIHIGGDEVSTTAAYLNEMIAYVESKGKKAEIWNPINGIGQDALNATLAQMWGTRGYLASGKANIDSRYNYTNHFDVFADLVGIYKSNIYYHEKGTPEVAGAVSGCWNDRKLADEKAIMAQNNVWANVIATAERAWIGGGKQYIDNMTNTPANLKADGGHGGVMLPNSGDEYEEFKSWETRFLFHKANSLKNEPIPYVKQTNVRWRITDAFPNGGSETAAFGPETAGKTASTEMLPEVFTHEGKTYYTGMATGAGIYLAHTWGNTIIDAYFEAPAFNTTAYAWTYVYSPEEQTVGAQIEFQNYSRSEQDAAAPAGKWDHYGSKIWINGKEIAAPTWSNTGVSISSKEVLLKNENFPGRKPIAVTLQKGWNKVFMKLPYFNKGCRLKKWMFTCVFTDTEGKDAVEGLIYSPNQCMDEATEVVAAEISEKKRALGNYISTEIGYWPASVAAELEAKVKEIEATYSSTMTEAERQQQLKELEEAWTTFKSNLTADKMNQPEEGKYYRMSTPLRDNRFPTGKGAGQAIIGEQNPATNASIWKFVQREDGSFDIVNYGDDTYISPASSNNTALNTVKTQPNSGWTLKPADAAGYVIITSGTAQFNQTNSGLQFKVYNWGDGTNISDTGCKYVVTEVEVTEDNGDGTAPKPFAFVGGTEFQAYPYAVSSSIASKVFAEENITIAIDVTMPSSMAANTRYALVCAADPTKAITGATKNNSPYVGFGLNGSNPVYLPSSASGDKFTYRDHTFAGNTNYKVVYVIDKTNQKFSIYVDGALKSSANYPVIEYYLQSFSNFATNANAKLYVGGGVVNNTTAHDRFGGKIHSVRFFEGALSGNEIAMIDYTKIPNDVVVNNVDEFIKGGVYTFITARGWMGATAENGNAISTARTNVTPAADNAYFQWTVYQSFNGNYYLYNIGKQKFLGIQSANNTDIPLVDTPAGKTLTFKQSNSTEYPIMFSTDNAGVVNHSPNHGGGLINWTGGWNNLDDAGSNHKVTLVDVLSAEEIQKIADIVEAYDKGLPVTTAIEGLQDNNPNTYLGDIRATNTTGTITTKLQKGEGVTFFSFDGTKASTIDFTRAYRGFNFQGYSVGNESLGKSLELTTALQERISEENPLVAKFTVTDDVMLFSDNDPFSYRIPAIGKTSTGRLIAVSDYRYSLDDIGRYNYGTANPGIDLVMRYSDDNGATWSETKTIAKGSCVRGTDDCAYGDAAIAVVGEKVLVMAAAGDVMFGNGSATAHNRAVRVFSEDNGQTWTKQDISETLFLGSDATIKNGYTAFFGSGRLAVDENYNGTGKARIYGALLLKKSSGTGNYVIYTDDLGLTWNILGGSQNPVASQDEPKVEILPSGQILLSIRRGGGRQFNVFTYTNKATNTGSWDSNVNGCNNGGSNTCNGEPYCIDAKNADGESVKLLLQSQPKGGSGLYDRRNVTIWYKEITDAKYTSSQIAAGWTQGIQVSTQLSAYSAMTLQDDGKIAFFFEEAPCFGDDQAKGYCMVYVPLTIEEITKGAYSTPEKGDATGIDTIVGQGEKAVFYDLSGRRVANPEKGIYVVNGKKVLK